MVRGKNRKRETDNGPVMVISLLPLKLGFESMNLFKFLFLCLCSDPDPFHITEHISPTELAMNDLIQSSPSVYLKCGAHH